MEDELEKDMENIEDDDFGEIDDVGITGKSPNKKPKAKDDDLLSLDDLESEEDEILPEDRFDDVEPEDLW